MESPGPGASRPLVVGVSLKMYFDIARTEAWSRRIAAIAAGHPAVVDGVVEVFVLPSLPALPAVAAALEGSPVSFGAQDLFWEDSGAYTGGISGADLRALGCTWVEVGHSERRRYFGEDDVTVNLKTAAALRHGLVPVLCVGERTRGGVDAAGDECVAQLESALSGLAAPDAPIVVAYEPEWAIGRAEAADADHVLAVTGRIGGFLRAQRSVGPARVVYGGSAGPGLLPRLDGGVQGLFLGRFAHDPEALQLILDDAMAVR